MNIPVSEKAMTAIYPDSQPHVVISGYYGFDNTGDELILQVLLQELKRRQVQITVLSAQPEKTALTYGVRALDRKNVIDILDCLSQATLLISGGGGLFQDVSGPLSPFYYGGLILIAKFLKVPVLFWSQGVGPLTGAFTRLITQLALQAADQVSVRDKQSAQIVRRLAGKMPTICADPVWLLETDGRKINQLGATKAFYIGLSLRPCKDLTSDGLDAFVQFCLRWVSDSSKPVRFLLLPFQNSQDEPLLKTFQAKMKASGGDVCDWVNPAEVVTTIGQCDFLFGMRYHSLLLALLMGVPVYGLIYDPKVQSLISALGLQGCEVKNLEYLDEAVIHRYYQQYPSPDIALLKEQAKMSLEGLDAMLDQAVQHTVFHK